MAHDVLFEAHVRDDAPRAAAVLVAHGDHDGVARLAALPVVVERVAHDRHVARVLQLEEILDDPVLAAPRGLLRELVVGDRDVRRDEARNARIGAAEYDVLGGALEIVVRDRVRPRTVPSGDRLRVLSNRLDVGNPAARDRRRRAVERDAALLPERRVAVDVDAVHNQIVGHLSQ